MASMKTNLLRKSTKSSKISFIIGVLLVAGSAVGVWLVVEANNHTDEYLVAAKPASSGSMITSDSFRVARMNLGEAKDLYLQPGDLKPGNYLLNTMAAGQLVALGSVASAIIDERQPVVISSMMPLPEGTRVGDFVDIWVSDAQANGLFLPPVTLVLDAEIVAITSDTGVMADGQPRVQVLVPVVSVSPILEAIASKSPLSMVLKRNLGND